MDKRKNVILITIDALRADHLSCLGYHRKTSPNLDNLAKDGILFTQAIANSAGTPASFQSILTSTYPLMFGGYGHLSKHRTTIAEVLKRNGYSTAAFHSNPFLSRHYGYARGFDTFVDFLNDPPAIKTLKYKAKDKIKKLLNRNDFMYKFAKKMYRYLKTLLKTDEISYVTAEVITKKALFWLRENLENNFFIWIHYMDVHEPCSPPYEYVKLFRPQGINKQEIKKLKKKLYFTHKMSYEELKLLIDLYDSKIRYVDNILGSFFDKLEDLGLLHNTLIVVTADHGEEFLEHGELAHHPKLYDELLHVPLIIYGPKFVGKNIKIDEPVGLIDLAPTILDILGIKKVKNFYGTSLLPLIEGKETVSDGGVISEICKENVIEGGKLKINLKKRIISYRTRNWKYIFDEENKRRELYYLRNDPKETKNLSQEEKEKVKEFESKILDHILMEERMMMISEEERIREKVKLLRSLNKL